jgi:ABC-type sulfate/molybdate transport systems ATPase subunit
MKQVTQEFDLMPYTTVSENIGEFLSNFYPEEKAARTAELLQVVELEAYKDRKVKSLSGGQKQRVALARALARSPQILLLDEPFSHIDNFKKHSLRRKVFHFLKAQKVTCLVATHDKEDVLGFADEILVLHEQSILRKGSPMALYQDPQYPLIASFFGEFSFMNGRIYYAHQLAIVASSDHEALVKGSFYNGRNWLIQAEYQSQDIFIEHHQSVAVGENICFSPKA